MHPNVVFGDVLSGFGVSLGNGQTHFRGNSFGEALRQANFGPLAAAAAGPILQTLFEGGERKIQQDDERQLVLKKVVENVGGGIVASDDFIEGQDGA